MGAFQGDVKTIDDIEFFCTDLKDFI